MGNEALYFSLKTIEKRSFRKKKRKKNKGKTIVESVLKLSLKSLFILSVSTRLPDISINRKLPATLINNPKSGISKEPLKKMAKSAAVSR